MGNPSNLQRILPCEPSGRIWAEGPAISLGGIPVTVRVPESVELPWDVVATQV